MRILTFLSLLTIVLCAGFTQTASAAKDTPKRVMKNKFYKSLDLIVKEKKYPFVMQNIKTRLAMPRTSKDDVNAAMFWMRDQYLYNNGDPKYGLSYVQFLDMVSGSLRKSDPEQAQLLKNNTIIHYFVSEFFIYSDIAYCIDGTAGANTRNQLHKIRPMYVNRYAALKPEDKKSVYDSIFSLIEERKARIPYTDICKSGAMYMEKAIGSGEYKEQKGKDIGAQKGSKVYIDSKIEPDLLNDQDWLQRRQSLLSHIQNELLAMQ